MGSLPKPDSGLWGYGGPLFSGNRETQGVFLPERRGTTDGIEVTDCPPNFVQ